jgi:hypothetical protein
LKGKHPPRLRIGYTQPHHSDAALCRSEIGPWGSLQEHGSVTLPNFFDARYDWPMLAESHLTAAVVREYGPAAWRLAEPKEGSRRKTALRRIKTWGV